MSCMMKILEGENTSMMKRSYAYPTLRQMLFG